MAQNQHATIQVPQLTMVQLHERFRWPTDHVLLLSMGVVATPGPEKANVLADMLPIGEERAAERCAAHGRVERYGGPDGAGSWDGRPRRAAETASLPGQTFHRRY